jgi:hypothetical protein
MRRRARAINFAIRPECRRHLRRQMLVSSKTPAHPTARRRDLRMRAERQRYPSQNEKTLVRMRQIFWRRQTCRKINLPKKKVSADANVSRGQMDDKIVAIGSGFP